jgi:hypothetical protein
MRVALIGPPSSGKTTLFAAVAQAGGSQVDVHRPDQSHMAVVKVPDERVDWLAALNKSEKITHAELEFVDLPGFDLASAAGRDRARAHWREMELADMLVFVVAAFQSPTVAAYRNRVDPEADVKELLNEMVFADMERVTARITKLDAALKKPTQHKDDQKRELDLMQRLLKTLEAERPVSEEVKTETEAKLMRSFQFLTLKPTLAVRNVAEGQAGAAGPEQVAGLPCVQLSAKIEEEIAQLSPAERRDFLGELGIDAPARDKLIKACYRALKLISFLTHGPDESRAWTVPAGTNAVTAAGGIHTDIARGFIRAEVYPYEEILSAKDEKALKAAGKIRLEGKEYVVKDGDCIYFRFNV